MLEPGSFQRRVVEHSCTKEVTHGTQSNAKAAWRDLQEGLRRWPVIVMLGSGEIASRYRRSVIGQFWITISNSLLIIAIGVVWAHIWKIPVSQFLPYLAAGHVFWLLLTTTITDASVCLINASAYLKELNLSKSIYILANVHKNLIILFHNLIIVPALLLVLDALPGVTLFLFIPALALVTLILIATSFWVAILGLRFRDTPAMLSSFMAVLFFLTPVIWKIEVLDPELQWWLALNPFYSCLELMRAPLLGHAPDPIHWFAGVLMLGVNTCLAVVVFVRYRSKITYWL